MGRRISRWMDRSVGGGQMSGHSKGSPHWEFPGSPVVRTLSFHCGGHGLEPYLAAELRSHILHGISKKKKKDRRLRRPIESVNEHVHKLTKSQARLRDGKDAPSRERLGCRLKYVANSLSSRLPRQTSLEPGGQPLAFLGPQRGGDPVSCALPPPLERQRGLPAQRPPPSHKPRASAHPACRVN